MNKEKPKTENHKTSTRTQSESLADHIRGRGAIELRTFHPEHQRLLIAYAADHARITHQRDQLTALKPHHAASYLVQHRNAVALLDAQLEADMGRRIPQIFNLWEEE